ncbi:MAG: hypothetical protein AUK44_02565 [Porphyromonadaceae bacterium CG2_30_38_12]|nr:MAG: hypothetical protein AUK44_02565 [Porphyromonadaceae bacterium CG2_30_38_12]
MDSNQIHETYKIVLHALSSKELKNAFQKGQLLVDELQSGTHIDRLNDLRVNYTLLLDYFMRGVDDAERKIVYNRIVAKFFTLICEVREELMYRNATNFEYQQKRYFPFRLHFSSYGKFIDAFKYFHAVESQQIENFQGRKNYEQLFVDIFAIFWLTTSYKNDELTLFQYLTDVSYPGRLEKNLVVSALTLNLWRMFDEEKLQLLLQCCNHTDVEIKQRALVGLCFVLARYNQFLPYFPQIRNRLVLLADDSKTAVNFRNIIVQIIGTVETDKITKKLRDEILPEVMKISPLLKNKMDTENLLQSDEWAEENPEWQELLDKSGVTEKLQELTDLQLEGADVYMGTFSMLKNFPFFNEISHWFLPFDSSFSVVNELYSANEATTVAAFLNNNAMCNSDKYSFCFSILQMPEMQRNNLKHAFKLQAEQLDEMAKDEAILMPEQFSKNISKQYIQDLFRFFKLFTKRADFSDMFGSALFMHRTYLFDILTSNSDLKKDVAEFYFSKSQYQQAIDLLSELVVETEPQAAFFQKMGYCYQQISKIDFALDAYLKADLILPNDLWTTKKIALCYKLIGDFKLAIDYYKQAFLLAPHQHNLQWQIANCYIEIADYKSALEVCIEVELQNAGSVKVQRAIVRCALLLGNLSQARYYAQQLLDASPETVDYLQAAYIEWQDSNILKTVSLLKKAIATENNDKQVVFEMLRNDFKKMKHDGILLPDFNLIWDGLH